jgi:hypothetical protein
MSSLDILTIYSYQTLLFVEERPVRMGFSKYVNKFRVLVINKR